jgi:hypothetical protein
MASASDLLAAMSGFRPIPSGFPPGPDVPGNPGIRGKMTLSRLREGSLNNYRCADPKRHGLTIGGKTESKEAGKAKALKVSSISQQANRQAASSKHRAAL